MNTPQFSALVVPPYTPHWHYQLQYMYLGIKLKSLGISEETCKNVTLYVRCDKNTFPRFVLILRLTTMRQESRFYFKVSHYQLDNISKFILSKALLRSDYI